MKTEDIKKICKQVRNTYPSNLANISDGLFYNVVEKILEFAGIKANPLMKVDPVMSVYAESTDRDYLIGFATGDLKDISAFYDDKKQYGLKISPIVVKAIPPGYAEQKAALVTKRDALQKQLDDLNTQIKRGV